jgi:hypothetical protein
MAITVRPRSRLSATDEETSNVDRRREGRTIAVAHRSERVRAAVTQLL